MRNLNVRAFIYVLLVVSVFVAAIVLYLTGTRIKGMWDALKQLPTVVSVDVILWALFAKWAWKWPIFQKWLVPFPCLQGTWEGTVQTTWEDPQTGKTPSPIPAILVIKQSFATVSCTMYTQEMTSQSYSAQFLIYSESNSERIAYSYTSKPTVAVRDRSAIHDGTALLDIITRPNRKLVGEYWTARKTMGRIEMKFKCKELLQAFPADIDHRI